MKYLALKITLGILTVGLIAFAAIIATNELTYQAMELSNYTLAHFILANTAIYSIFMAVWAFAREGAMKGALWTMLFFATGAIGAGLYITWNLISVSEKKDLKTFFLGKEKKAQKSTSGSSDDGRPSQTQVSLPSPA